ncbi:MAG: hypothetical protein GC129_03760 [Proteobacteria bacterium]|nr:hypothetical protein [Pseudomonadota bacterium]
MKVAFLGMVVAALALTGALQAQAASPTQIGAGAHITYDMSDLPLLIVVDKSGTASVEELPFPGEVIYQPSTGTIYYHHPEEDGWLSLTSSTLAPLLAPVQVVADKSPTAAWKAHPTTGWEVKSGTTTCDQWVGSPYAAQQGGLNVADILRIITAVQWLNAGTLENTCEKIGVSAAEAAKVGLPVLFTGPNGRWQLQDLTHEAVSPIAIPKATPLTDDARLRLLLVQFSPEERAQLLERFGNLPLPGQIQAISQLLNEEALP